MSGDEGSPILTVTMMPVTNGSHWFLFSPANVGAPRQKMCRPHLYSCSPVQSCTVLVYDWLLSTKSQPVSCHCDLLQLRRRPLDRVQKVNPSVQNTTDKVMSDCHNTSPPAVPTSDCRHLGPGLAFSSCNFWLSGEYCDSQTPRQLHVRGGMTQQ